MIRSRFISTYGVAAGWCVIFALVIFGRAFFPPENQMIYGHDANILLYQHLETLVRSVKQGSIPFWNPYNFTGVPLLANPIGGSLFYPLNIIFFLLPVPVAFAVQQFLHVVIAGIGMYWFCRRMLMHIPSLVAAMVFAFSGYMAAHTFMGHIESIAALAWLPVIFRALMEITERFRKRMFVLGVGALAMQILTGTHITVLLTLELLTLYVLYFAGCQVMNRSFRNAARTVLVYVFMVSTSIGLTAFQLFPVTEYAMYSVRAQGLPYEMATRGSMRWEFLRLFIDPGAFGGDPFNKSIIFPDATTNVLEYVYYVGKLPLIIAVSVIFYMVIRWKRVKHTPYLLFFSIAAFVFFLLSFGKNLPFYDFFHQSFFPIRFFRVPARQLMIVTFILAFITGAGSQMIRSSVMRVIVLVAVTAELVIFYLLFVVLIPIPGTFDPVLLTRLKEDLSGQRVYTRNFVYSKAGWLFFQNNAPLYKIPTINGYNELILDSYNRFITSIAPENEPDMAIRTSQLPLIPLSSRFLNFLGVRYIFADMTNESNIKPVGDDKVLVMGNDQFALFQNPHALSRQILVPEIIQKENDNEIEQLLKNGAIDLSKAVATTDNVWATAWDRLKKTDPCQLEQNKSNIILTEDSPNRMKLRVNTSCHAVLSISDAYYPGWQARIDGYTVPIARTNVAFRGIIVPKGDHTVEIYYWPRIYIGGIAVSILTFGIFLVIYGLRKQTARR